MSALGRWYLNTVDVFASYGLAVMEGNASFLAFPKRKDSLNHSWPEENGMDIDLGTPRFEAKECRLKCAFIAPDHTAYWNNRNAFFAALTQPGWQVWRIADHQKDYSVFYRESANFQVRTKRLQGVDSIVATFDLTLVVSDELIANAPGSGEVVYIKDQHGNIITTQPPGSTYTVQYLTEIHGGELNKGDEQYNPIIGLIQGEPL